MQQLVKDYMVHVANNIDLYKTMIKFEDKNNLRIEQLFKSGAIGDVDRKKLKSSGSRRGVMFCLPKVHKKDTPLRSILSTSGSLNYNLSRYMVELLSPIT